MDRGNQVSNDDQELAKVLAGTSGGRGANLQFEETGNIMPPGTTPTSEPSNPSAPPASSTAPGNKTTKASGSSRSSNTSSQQSDSNLDGIRRTALGQLRPIIGKLDVSPEEKFDTYLLLLRSTDDKTLIAPAHEAAGQIPDEARRAQALLDIIKEIDYFSSTQR